MIGDRLDSRHADTSNEMTGNTAAQCLGAKESYHAAQVKCLGRTHLLHVVLRDVARRGVDIHAGEVPDGHCAAEYPAVLQRSALSCWWCPKLQHKQAMYT